MPDYVKLSDHAVRAVFRSDATTDELAREWGIDRSTVSRIWRKEGKNYKRILRDLPDKAVRSVGRRPSWTFGQAERLRSMIRSGLPRKLIADALGKSINSINGKIRRMGCQTKRPSI